MAWSLKAKASPSRARERQGLSSRAAARASRQRAAHTLSHCPQHAPLRITVGSRSRTEKARRGAFLSAVRHFASRSPPQARSTSKRMEKSLMP